MPVVFVPVDLAITGIVDEVEVEAASVALIGRRGVDEPVAEHDAATRECRFDDLGHMLPARGEVFALYAGSFTRPCGRSPTTLRPTIIWARPWPSAAALSATRI